MVRDFKIYKMKLKVLSPLFIGSGESYDRCDYIYDGEIIHIIKQDKWIDYLIKNDLLDKFMQRLETDGKNLEIDNWIKSEDKDLSEVIKKCCINKFKVSNMDDFKSNIVHSFIKNIEGKPYIPGSSIKGAIISAIIGYYANKKNLNEEYIKNFKIKGISVSDSNTFELDNLELYKKKDNIIINNEENQNELPIYRECAKEGTEVEFTIKIDNKLIKESKLNDFDGIKTIYEALKYKLDTLYNEESGIINRYETILNYLPGEVYNQEQEDEGILILGGGAGFHSKSIVSSIYEFNDAFDKTQEYFKKGIAQKHHHENDNVICPRAIKLVDVGKLVYMGFCKISEIK